MSNIRMQAEITDGRKQMYDYLPYKCERGRDNDWANIKILYRTNKPVLLAVNKVDNLNYVRRFTFLCIKFVGTISQFQEVTG